MAKLEERYQELYPRMQRLSDFKTRPSQVLWRPTVPAYTKPLIEGPLHRLCDQLIVVRRLKERQLQLDPRHCQLIDQDGVLQAS